MFTTADLPATMQADLACTPHAGGCPVCQPVADEPVTPVAR